MRKYLTSQTAAWVVVILGALAALGGYWYTQQQKLSELQQQINQLPNSKDKVLLVKDRIALENTINGSLVQATGGFLLFATAYVSFQTLKATQRNVLVAEEKQVTERFTQAINQLGSDKIEIRFGGIYALERIAKDSPKDHWTIMEVLTSFIQEKSPRVQADEVEEGSLPSIAKDVQAALTVIGRRKSQQDLEDENLMLSRTYLRRANLSKAYLSEADLSEADLNGANLNRADLRRVALDRATLSKATLSKATLTGAFLYEANLSSATLSMADLSRARLYKAFLYEANLAGADLRRADLAGVNLSEAFLYEADLTGANLRMANLTKANLTGADLTEADLTETTFRNVKGLTPEQVKAAENWEEANYDEDFRQKLGLPPKEEL